jgi:NADH dehydrogenase
MLKTDNVVRAGAKTLVDLKVTTLESVEAIVPSYLYRFKPYGQFQVKRKAS